MSAAASRPPGPRPPVEVAFHDPALVALVVHAARSVAGVVRLQRRPLAAWARRAGAVGRRPDARQAGGFHDDATAVDVVRGPGGDLAVSIAVVSTTSPPPREVVAAVAGAVRDALGAVEERRVDLEITVADVEP